VDGVMDTWALAPSAEREVVAAAGAADVGTGPVLSGHLPSAGIVGMVLAAIPANMVALWARPYSSPEALSEMFANRVRHPEVERSSHPELDRRTLGYVVVESVEILTWAETDMPCFEQSRTPLWPNSGQERTGPGLIYLGVRRVMCLKIRDSMLRIA
jgi:hypothetical protein